jgi:cation:H+ antiporter
MSLATIFFFLLGLGLLAGGAEMLVRGAARIAVALGIPSLLVGLTIVAYCTSAPELAVSISSARAGQTALAVGNIIGSNIFNILFILGISSALVPLVVAGQLIRFDVPVMLASSIAMYVMALDGVISQIEGALLFVGMLLYTTYLIFYSRSEKRSVQREYDAMYVEKPRARIQDHARNITLLVLGLGAQWLVESATTIARAFGVSELIIGLTVVAIGTSLPEVAASVVASLRHERDIAVGNAIGSNLSNILLVLGIAAIVAPNGLPVPASALNFDLPVMIGVSVACLPIFFTGRLIARWEGGVFLMFYFLYNTYVILAATQQSILSLYQAAVLFFIIPLTIVTLLGTTVRAVRAERKKNAISKTES